MTSSCRKVEGTFDSEDIVFATIARQEHDLPGGRNRDSMAGRISGMVRHERGPRAKCGRYYSWVKGKLEG